MPTIAAALVVLVLVLQEPAFSSAKFSGSDLSSPPGRSLSEFKDNPTTLGIDLKHAFHVDSPYGQMDLTPSQKRQLVVESSKHRMNHFSRILSGKAATTGTGDAFTIPVQHEPAGGVFGYNMEITLGTPPSTKHPRLDTGSDLVWVQCNPCIECFNGLDPIFSPANSSSYSNISCTAPFCEDLVLPSAHACSLTQTCDYGYGYGDLSTTFGNLAFENFTFTSSNSTSVFTLAFGCGNDNVAPGDLFRGTDGIVGLGRGPLSLISQLGIKIVPVFSYCLVDFAAAGTNTSLLLLGSAGNATLAYTPLYKSASYPSFYYVNLTGISVNKVPVVFPPDTFQLTSNGSNGMILDSGSTLTSIFDAAYKPFTAILIPLITYPKVDPSVTGLDHCYNTSNVTSPTFPDVSFQFENVELNLPQDNSFWDLGDGIACLAVVNGTGPSPSIVGNIMQQNFQIAYDLGNRRVGFAYTACS